MVARNVVTFIGRLGASEEWSTRYAFGGVTPGAGPYSTEAELAAWADAAGPLLVSSFNTAGNILKSMLSSEGTIDTLRIDYLGPNDVVEASVEEPLGLLGANGIAHPYQTAVCLSMLTGLPGASRRGRSYWPFLTGTLAAPGAVLSSQQRTDIGIAVRNLLTTLENNQPDADRVVLGVASEVQQVVTPVTSISIGNTLDTQRRRRNGLIELYTNVSFPA